MECIAVDWSGAASGAASKIWMARAVGGSLTALVAPGSRDGVRDALLSRRRDAASCLVGLDFAFSVPAWFAAASGWRHGRDVWSAARDEGELWLRECAPPFWGRAGVSRPHHATLGLRETERAWTLSPRPKSVFQIGGAGAVGTGSIRGMPLLLALQDAGWAVWPFDAPGTHTLVEIYPRLFTGPLVKRHASARLRYLSLTNDLAATRADFLTAMISSDDAFDAGVSAVAMSRAAASTPLRAIDDSQARIEGRIWVPGAA